MDYAVIGADAKLSAELKDVWKQYDGAKAVLQRIDHRIQQHTSTTQPSEVINPGSKPTQDSIMQVSKTYGQHVGFKEPLVSYHEQHDPKTSLRGSNPVDKYLEGSTFAYSARDFNNTDYDSLRVSLSKFDPSAENPRLFVDQTPVNASAPPNDSATESPKDQVVSVRELNSDTYFEPSGRLVKPGKNLSMAGVAQTVTNMYPVNDDFRARRDEMDASVNDSSMSYSQLPKRRYDAAKQKKKLEENSEGLAKLKETIRRQKENRSPSSMQSVQGQKFYHKDDEPIPSYPYNIDVPKPRIRKIAVGPAAPKYKGFNTAETRLKTPDGKVWREDGTVARSRPSQNRKTKAATSLFGNGPGSNRPKPADPAAKQKDTGKKASSRSKTTRKIGKIQADNPSHKKAIITPSSWREGQKVAEAILGPMPKQKKTSGPSVLTHSPPTKDTTKTKERDALPTDAAALSCNNNNAAASATNNNASATQEVSAMLNANDVNVENDNTVNEILGASPEDEQPPVGISVNVKEMLSDLKSSSSSSSDTETEDREHTKMKKSSARMQKKRRPAALKQAANAKPEPVKRVRHYDQSQVQKYMAKQKAERRKKEAEMRKQEREANERKQQQLHDLDKRQKEARKKTLSSSVQEDLKVKNSLQDTFTKSPTSAMNSARSIGNEQTGVGYESRIASYLNKLDRYRHLKQSDEDNEARVPPGGTKVSEFMSKLDQYLNEDTTKSLPEKSSAQFSPRRDEEGDLTVADLSTDQRTSPLKRSSSPQQVSPRFTAVASYIGQPELNHMDRIAALRAKSDLLQERIDMQAKCLLQQPVDTNKFSSLPYFTPFENHLISPSRPTTSQPTEPAGSPESQAIEMETDISLPGVANLREHVANSERQRLEHEASTKIQANYKGHAVRHALETWELPSGNTLLHSKSELNDSTSSSTSSSTTPRSDVNSRSVDDIMESLTRKEFCAGVDKPTWAEKMQSDQKASDGTDVLQDLKSRLRPHTSPTSHSSWRHPTEEELSKAPWQRSHGDKYSIPNLFAHKYLKSLRRQQKAETQSGFESEVATNPRKDFQVTPLSPDRPKTREAELLPSAQIQENLGTALPKPDETNQYENDFQSMSSLESSARTSTEDKASSQTERSKESSSSSGRSQVEAPAGNPQLHDPAELISWSKSLRRDAEAVEAQQGSLSIDLSSEVEPGTEANYPPPNLPAPSQGSLRFSPAVLEHKMALELNRYEAADEAMKQLNNTERTQSVALAQQETVSLAQILQSRQLQHQIELDRLTMKAKEEALEAARHMEKMEAERQMKEAKDREEFAQKQSEMALKLQEQSLKNLKAQQQMSESAKHPFSPHKKQYKADDYSTMSDKSYSTSSDASTKTPGSDRSYSTSTFSSYQKSHEIALPAKKDHRSPPSIVSEHSTTSIRQSDDDVSIPEQIADLGGKVEISESKSISENIEGKLSFDDTDRSITEEILTSEKPRILKKAETKSSLKKPDPHDMSDVASVTFDESVTEDEIAEISRRAIVPSESHRRMQRRKSPMSKPAKDEDLYDHSNLSVSSDDTLPAKGRLSSLEESFSGPTSLFGDSDIGGFSQFLNATVQQYMHEQEVRMRHQSVMLKLREKAIKEKTQAELAWLEQQKQQIRSKGEDDKMPPIKKKKRAILIRLQVETEEIKKLRAANKAALKDRELIMKQHKDISRIMQSTQQIKEKLKTGSNTAKAETKPKLSLSPDTHITSSTPVPQIAESPSVSEDDVSIHNSDIDTNASSRLLKHLKVISSGLDDRRLTQREKGLLKRKKQAERLLEWKRKLDEEEQKVIDIEKKAISAWAQEDTKEKSNKTKPAAEVQKEVMATSSERQSSVSPSESSIAEEVVTQGAGEDASTTTSSSVHEDNKPPGYQDLSSEGTIGDDYSQSFDSSTRSIGKTATNKDESQSASTDKQVAAKKLSKPSSTSSSPGPTTPLLGYKKTSTGVRIPKKREIFDSGSDESFSQTQSETEQSDVECRVHVLQEELRQRQLIAEKLKKQQKKKRKEHLRAQEASLKSQIEAYDALIKKTKQELTQELDSSGPPAGSNGTSVAVVAKPQIRSPRKSEQARQAGRSRKYVMPVQSPEASPRAGSQKGVGPNSIITKQRSDSDSSGRSSRSLSFEDDPQQQQHSPDDAINGLKPPIHPLQFGSRPTDKLTHSSAESSPTASAAAQERPNKLELFGAKLAPLATASIGPPLPSLSKQTTPDKPAPGVKSLIPKPSKAQSPKQRTSSSSPDVSHAEETSKSSSSVFKSSLPVPVKILESPKAKDDSPTSPPSGYADDFEPSSTATDDDVSENISEHSTDKSDASVPLLDLSAPTSLQKSEMIGFDDEDDEKTPVASPSATPTPSPPNTPTPQNTPLPHDEIGVDVVDGASWIGDVRKHDVIPSDVVGKASTLTNKQLAEKISEEILRSLVEESMNVAIEARQLAGSRDFEESRRRKQKDSDILPPYDSSKRIRRNESSQLAPSSRNLLQILTDDQDEKEPAARDESHGKAPNRDDVSNKLTSNLLNETINEVLEIRKQRAKKWAEASFPRDYENGSEVESILQDDGKRKAPASNERTGLESDDVDREPAIARPVSPIFGSSQDDVSEEWFDDDMYIPPYQGKKRDDTPIVNVSDDWPAEDIVLGPPIIKLAVPSQRDDVMQVVNEAVDFYYEHHVTGEFGSKLPIPEKFLDDPDVTTEVDRTPEAKAASRVFKTCIFELVWELMAEAYGTSHARAEAVSPWIKMRRKRRPSFCKATPKTKSELASAVSEEINKLFNFSGVRRKLDSRLTLKWGTMKKKDNVDLLLIDELREEEPDWTNYDEDETTVKMQLADSVMDFLLLDTLQCFNRIEQKKLLVES